MAIFSLHLHMARGGEGALSGLSNQGSHPIYEISIFPKASPVLASHWGLGFQTRMWRWGEEAKTGLKNKGCRNISIKFSIPMKVLGNSYSWSWFSLQLHLTSLSPSVIHSNQLPWSLSSSKIPFLDLGPCIYHLLPGLCAAFFKQLRLFAFQVSRFMHYLRKVFPNLLTIPRSKTEKFLLYFTLLHFFLQNIYFICQFILCVCH